MEKFMLIFQGGINQDASPQDMQSNLVNGCNGLRNFRRKENMSLAKLYFREEN
jgi:hypothetical protein